MSSLHPTTTSEANIKPECIVSSGYDPIKSEETDDEDCKDIDDTSNSHQNISIKEEAVKAEVKAEEDISTDDERSPEYIVSSSSGYIPVKSEETDDEDSRDTNNISNEQNLPIKEEGEMKVKAEEDNVSTDDEYGNEKPVRPPDQSNASVQESMDIQHTRKKKRSYCNKRKREVESNKPVQKVIRIECSVEGCNRKAAGNGRCRTDHGGYNLCSQEECTNKAQKGGVCARHGAVVKNKICTHDGCTNQAQKGGVCVKHGAILKTCSHDGCTNIVQNRGVCIMHGAVVKTCKHEGCTNQVYKGGVCVRHGAQFKAKTCKHEGCTKQAKKGGVCMKHGAKVKTCSHEGCTKYKGGLCKRHYRLSNGESVAV